MPEVTFPALSGKMGDRDFYMTVMSLRDAAAFFDPTPASLPAELRAQRPLQEKRIPEIAQYLIEKEDDWVFGSLTVSFDGESSYSASKSELTFDTTTDFVIVDGQHRLAAIQRAIKDDPLLRTQQIGVMLIPFESLDRNQQMFSDLNRTVQKTSRSLDILYDHDDPMNGVVKAVAARVPLFKNRVEKNATSLAVRSRHFITLSSLYDACRQLLGGQVVVSGLKSDDEAIAAAEELCVAYWTALSELIEPWQEVLQGDMKPAEARINFIAAHAVAFWALGTAGSQVLGIQSMADWSRPIDLSVLQPLSQVDWAKTNPDWQGIVMLGNAVVTRHQTRAALSKRICHLVSPEDFEDASKVLEVAT
ncbi:DNA sulfur modification protein DndB [Janibacter terrae]|uniref:DNA sulfur modification protein DndB n=1 Tax=Janibacter terrae TaxID=103817 RepID=UPI0031F88B01